jgi:hypothetical protein
VRRSFLLIVRTSQIVTAALLPRVLEDARSFQHMARFIYVTTTSSPRFYSAAAGTIARLSIVTAAVYRGFDQELRLAADPIN